MSNKTIKTIQIKTNSRDQFIDITHDIVNVINDDKIGSGICCVYVPHTTAGVTINENADPDVRRDMILGLSQIVPDNLDYKHAEGNSPAHIKSSLIGNSVNVIVENGSLLLGTWQGVYFCEFDGPRSRKVYIKIVASR